MHHPTSESSVFRRVMDLCLIPLSLESCHVKRDNELYRAVNHPVTLILEASRRSRAVPMMSFLAIVAGP